MPEYDHRQKPMGSQCYHIQFAVLKVQRMSAAPMLRSLMVTMGKGCIYIAIIVISIIGCHSEKLATDSSKDGVMAGFHCKADPKCLCFKRENDTIYSKFCEEKVILSRSVLTSTVHFNMECKAQTEVDPYYYLSNFLSTNFSSPTDMDWAELLMYNFSNFSYPMSPTSHILQVLLTYMYRAELLVSNCSAPSSNHSVLLGDWSTGSIGGWRNLTLDVFTIKCEESKIFHFPMHRWNALEELKILKIICPKLSIIDEDLFSMISKELEFLQITDTEVRDLPKRFFTGIKTIKRLDLSRNKIRSFESSFLSNMRNLEELYLGENEIATIDDDIFLKTKNLIHLSLGRNSLKTLPTSLCKLKKLGTLNVEYNLITFIPEECLNSLPSMYFFKLSGNKLLTFGLPSVTITPNHYKVVSSDFPNLSSIAERSENLTNAWIGWSLAKYLHLDNNSLSSLPDEAFYGMNHLKILDISSNRITYLPENIFSRNKKLYILRASNNLLTHIPATLLKNNTGLEILDLSFNLIETLDLDFFSCPTPFCYVHINNNRFRHLPEKIFQPFKEACNRICEEFFLDMSGNRLEDVPELSIPGLTHLNLSNNCLTLIKPDMFTQTPRLLEVNLSHNLIHTIENPLKFNEIKVLFSINLINLTIIDLSSNRLTVYPSITPVLKTLKHLNLSRNYITEFAFESEAEEIIPKTEFSLEIVDLSHNRLNTGDLDENLFFEFKNLKHLDLSHNRIDLEGCMEYVESTTLVWGCLSPIHWPSTLEVIILSHNDIAYIPKNFHHNLPELRFVDLSHNKIKRLWHEDLLFTRVRDYMDLRVAPKDFDYLPIEPPRLPGSNNLTIDLRHNSISSLQLPDDKTGVVLPGCDIDSKFSRVKLLLGHNPFVCDCEVFKLLRYVSKEMRPMSALERLYGNMLVGPAVIDLQDLHCSKPDSVKGKAVADVESWAYHLLPLIGFCWNETGVNSVSGHKTTSSTEAGAVLEPPE
ncbi:protein artichoke-like [Ischnura elegans]|uniref:protein artichoke-like n=1 Tax=Ischnura elegans TaxID=197161 RepID=UPI001ED8ABFE|nr:protein artichoke-like [Ischnura elegans]